MIEIRSEEGRLLCKVSDDFTSIEIVQRRRRYVWTRGQAGPVHAVVVAYAVEENSDDKSDKLSEFRWQKGEATYVDK